MSQVVLYLTPNEDLDEQRESFRDYAAHAGCMACEEYVGDYPAAKKSAALLGVPLIDATVLGRNPEPPKPAPKDPEESKEAALKGADAPNQVARREKAAEFYRGLEKRWREVELLGITSLNGIARYFNEAGVPTRTGKGKWSAAQIKRAVEWRRKDENA